MALGKERITHAMLKGPFVIIKEFKTQRTDAYDMKDISQGGELLAHPFY